MCGFGQNLDRCGGKNPIIIEENEMKNDISALIQAFTHQCAQKNNS